MSRNGAEYEVANGATIPNFGERRCEVMTVGSLKQKRITFQVADSINFYSPSQDVQIWASIAFLDRMEDN